MTASAETLAHPACDEVARIAAHLPCLERAAADPSAPALVRRALWAEIAAARVALALLGADLPDASERFRTIPDASGPFRMVPGDLGEVGRGC